MKILKDAKTALLLKSFLLENRDYLGVTVLGYFDLNNPEAPLEEQAMYRDTKSQLGKTLLDYAMPKPEAEVLLCGTCHNPLPQSGVARVSLKVGETIERELYVFGERRWRNGLITDPLPFETMLLDHAHGTGDEEMLPNIEEPDDLTVTRGEKRTSVSFMPIDIFGAENMKKLGTFDGNYKRDLWPGFAADMDYTFFNVAPKRQRQESFFEGGETIELHNMHPENRRMVSHIPRFSFRCFATRQKKGREEAFVEVVLRRDTLWLFPEIEKGIVVFHGTLEVADEIYSDIRYLNIKPVFAGEAPKTAEAYYALQKKELTKSETADEAPFEEAEKKKKAMEKEMFALPRRMKEGMETVQGKRPLLKRTPAEMLERAQQQIDDAIARLEQTQNRKQHGRIGKRAVDSFTKMKEKLLETKAQLAKSLQEIEKEVAATEAMKEEALAEVEKIKSNPNIPDEVKAKIDTSFLEPEEKVWHDHAFDFVCDSVKILEKSPQTLRQLRHLGLTEHTIERNWVGFNPKEKRMPASEWKLEGDGQIVLPKGFVTARFEETALKALRIEGKPVLGSDEAYALFLSEGNDHFPLFYLTDELQAYLCDQEAYDICNTLVCDDLSKVGKTAKEALEKASVIFYLEENGSVETLPHARKFDCGEYGNLFELHQNDEEIREQIIQNLPEDAAKGLPLKRDTSVKSLMKRVNGQAQGMKKELKAEGEALRKALEKERDEAFEKANKLLKEKGLEPIVQEPHTPSEGFIKPSEVAQHFDDAIAKIKKQNREYPNLSLENAIAKLEAEKEKMVALAQWGEKQYMEGMAKLAAAEERAKDPTPDWAKEMMKKAGIDPNDPHPPELTRERVVEMYEKGDSFKGRDLSGLDLSSLDLHGIDLQQANCQGTDFSHTNLRDANLTQTNCSEADFTRASLDGAKAQMTLFPKAVFVRTRFGALLADKAFFSSVTLKESTFEKAKLQGVTFKGAVLEKSLFGACEMMKTSFIDSELKGCDFSASKMDKTLWNKSRLEGCFFLEVEGKEMLFTHSDAHTCDFSKAVLYNMRVLKQSSLRECNLSFVSMKKSTIFEGTLEECTLQKSDLGKSIVKQSTLNRCDFRGAVAKGTRFEYAEATACSFVGIDLFRGSLRRMDLKFCDFSHANLYGVEFYKSKLYEVKFDNANLTKSNLDKRVGMIYD